MWLDCAITHDSLKYCWSRDQKTPTTLNPRKVIGFQFQTSIILSRNLMWGCHMSGLMTQFFFFFKFLFPLKFLILFNHTLWPKMVAVPQFSLLHFLSNSMGRFIARNWVCFLIFMRDIQLPVLAIQIGTQTTNGKRK